MPYEFGQIVRARMDDGHGNWKIRPVVIVIPTAEIVPGEPLLVVCISTQVARPLPDDHVPLPWMHPHHPRTGLNKPNVAKCDWVVGVRESDIIEIRGIVPPAQLAKIEEILRRKKSDRANGPPAG